MGNTIIDYVLGFAFDKTLENVALIQKLRPDWQKGKFNGVGGKVEEEEDVWQSMAREFVEESGIKTEASDWILVDIIELPEANIWVFCTIVDVTKAKSITDEQVVVYKVRDLPQNRLENIEELIDRSIKIIKKITK